MLLAIISLFILQAIAITNEYVHVDIDLTQNLPHVTYSYRVKSEHLFTQYQILLPFNKTTLIDITADDEPAQYYLFVLLIKGSE